MFTLSIETDSASDIKIIANLIDIVTRYLDSDYYPWSDDIQSSLRSFFYILDEFLNDERDRGDLFHSSDSMNKEWIEIAQNIKRIAGIIEFRALEITPLSTPLDQKS